MGTISFARKSLTGKDVFEVPVIHTDWGSRPRAPERAEFSAFYTAERDRCFIVCGGASAKYMHRRRYARHMGTAVYDPASPIASGLSHTLEVWPE